MEIAMVGLGRMGGNMARRLLRGGHRVVLLDRKPAAAEAIAREETAGVPATDPADAAAKLTPPRIVWVMLPAGKTTEDVLQTLIALLQPGDVLIDGGNSRYTDSIRCGEQARSRGIRFLDIGVSGGVWGLEEGYCMMAGGGRDAFLLVEPLLRTLAPQDGYAHVGAGGAGHFTKMVHNGIEYGMLQAIGEGFEIMHVSQFQLDLHQVAHLWNQGGVVRSWLLELTERVFESNATLDDVRGYVEDSGEGRWTVLEALERNVPAPVITLSLLARLRSRQEESFSAKTIAALRREFGGHAVKKEE